jgi:hypothetical protein
MSRNGKSLAEQLTETIDVYCDEVGIDKASRDRIVNAASMLRLVEIPSAIKRFQRFRLDYLAIRSQQLTAKADRAAMLADAGYGAQP